MTRTFLLILAAAAAVPYMAAHAVVLDLSGEWRFAADPEDCGVAAKWFESPLPEDIRLPGTMDEAGKGVPSDKVEVSWLHRPREYAGAAWYQREVEIPAGWEGMTVSLFLERPHWESRVWLDGREMGVCDSLCAPHAHTLGTVAPGKHLLAVRVDNRMLCNVGVHAHSVANHTQTNWNGIIGRIELRGEEPVRISSMQVWPDPAGKRAAVRAEIANDTGMAARGRVVFEAVQNGTGTVSAAAAADFTAPEGAPGGVEAVLELGDAMVLWDEFNPAWYRLTARVEAAGRRSSHETVFGMRALESKDGRFYMNGRPHLVRGNLECCIFPLTGYPAMGTPPWDRMMGILKACGLNHIRFHSWCPPEAAFTAADNAGVTLQVETPVWTMLGGDPVVDDFIHREADRILAAYGNHPSFTMLCVGNEPAGKNQQAFLQDIVTEWKAKDSRRLYTGASGWPEVEADDYMVRPERDTDNRRIPLRLHGGVIAPRTDLDYAKALETARVPVVAHELGQWCVYPDYREIKKYTGVLRPDNLSVFRASLEARGMLPQNRDFTRASAALQLLLYKADVEAVLRTPGMGGYQLLSLQDFPGQGTALVGLLDAFWDGKSDVITPKEIAEFCGQTVPLARMERLAWTTDQTFHAALETAHFGPAPLENVTVRAVVTDARGTELACRAWTGLTIPLGNANPVGALDWELKDCAAPGQFTLTVTIEGTPFRNHWNFWVYPARLPEEDGGEILITDTLDRRAERRLARGGTVLLMPKTFAPKKAVKTSFEPIFWNMQWFPAQHRQLGLICDPAHPAFAQFPTAGHSDWQWFELLTGGRAVVLDDFPPALKPLAQLVDDWNTNRKLGALVEMRAGRGRLMICTLNISDKLEGRPAARQLRHSLLAYMNSDAFNPETAVELDTIRACFAKPRLTVAGTDGAARGYEGGNAVDGDPQTCWHTPYEGDSVPGFPHEIVVELDRAQRLAGMTYVPRQDVPNGWIAGYEVYVSGDGKDWGAPAASGTFGNNGRTQTVRFAKPRTGRFLRLVATSGIKPEPFATVAELDVIKAD